MSKRCEAVWQYANKAKGASARCTERASKLVVSADLIHRFCTKCATEWLSLRSVDFQTGGLGVLGVLEMHDSESRNNPEIIRALRVKAALVARSPKP
jgi:hypothetical protein